MTYPVISTPTYVLYAVYNAIGYDAVETLYKINYLIRKFRFKY